jgi:L-lactate dehydrogenase complex protein LldF
VGRQALRCIRCSACLNFCPVYERTGGHAYGSVYPGPIGAILNPLLNGVEAGPVEKSLPYASSLCGRCFEVCPVRIDIPDVLVHLRGKVVDASRKHRVPSAEMLGMRAAGWAFDRPGRLAAVQRLAGFGRRLLGDRAGLGPIALPGPAAKWSRARDVPLPPRQSFRAWWAQRNGTGSS